MCENSTTLILQPVAFTFIFVKEKNTRYIKHQVCQLQYIAFHDLNKFHCIGKVPREMGKPDYDSLVHTAETKMKSRLKPSWVFIHYKYLTNSQITTIKATIPTTDNSMHMQEQPPLVRLFKTAKFFCTRCFHNRNIKYKQQVNVNNISII